MNSKDFVPHNIALEMKSLGFNEPCFGRWLIITEWGTPTGEIRLQIGAKAEDYDKEQFHAPTFSQCFRWFREKHGMCGHIKPENNEEDAVVWEYVILTIENDLTGLMNVSEVCFTLRKSGYALPEEAELACLIKLIEIVKQQSNEN